MSPQKLKMLAGVALCIAFIGVAVMALHGIRVEKYRDNKAAGGEVNRPLDFLAVHSSQPRYLTVNEQTYRGIRGSPPYYLDVPALNSILFVTGEIGGHTMFHLVNLDTKQHIEFDGATSGFGGQIGASRKPGEPFTDYVKAVSSNRITLEKRTADWAEQTVLDLETRTAEKAGTVYFKTDGVSTNR